MTDETNSVVLLSRALDQTGDVLAAIRPEQLSLPTPCSDWDVARLVAHVVATPRTFVEMASGGTPDFSAEPPPVDSDWAGAFRSAADELMGFWQQAGSDAADDGAEGPPMDWQLAELAVHTWDLVRATGQSPALDDEVAERGLAFMTAGLTPENRGGVFAAEVPAPADAPAYDRIAAFAGRDPHWHPA